MRIGTWNLQGRWDDRHLRLLTLMDCDVLLLTEVAEKVDLPGFELHASSMRMAARRHWAAVASRLPLVALPDPHRASAMAVVDGLRVCSSVLPWRSCGTRHPWAGTTTAEKTESAVDDIASSAPTVWGGHWNHAMSGREWTGSNQGRRSIIEAVDRLGLQVVTADLPHQIAGLLSIDHIAVPAGWECINVEHHSASPGGVQISDHDAYVVDAAAR